MRKSIISATILAAVLGSSAAFAGQTTGQIKAVDDAAMTVTLANGSAYTFNDKTDRYDMLGGYLPGDNVTIVWDMVGDKHEALAMSPDFSGAMIGKISAVNPSEESVTLEDGAVYSFLKDTGKVDVGGFKAGDDVMIVATTDGGKHMGRAIQSVHSAEMTGKLKAIDTALKTVTLEDGTVVNFDKDTHVALGGYKVGDMVTFTGFKAGQHTWGTSMSPAHG